MRELVFKVQVVDTKKNRAVLRVSTQMSVVERIHVPGILRKSQSYLRVENGWVSRSLKFKFKLLIGKKIERY